MGMGGVGKGKKAQECQASRGNTMKKHRPQWEDDNCIKKEWKKIELAEEKLLKIQPGQKCCGGYEIHV